MVIDMSTSEEIKTSFIRKEIKDIKSKIDYYETIYSFGDIKCINLRKLIVLKQSERSVLEHILEARTDDNSSKDKK